MQWECDEKRAELDAHYQKEVGDRLSTLNQPYYIWKVKIETYTIHISGFDEKLMRMFQFFAIGILTIANRNFIFFAIRNFQSDFDKNISTFSKLFVKIVKCFVKLL